MPKLKLAEEWTYRTPLVTRTYRAGTHDADNDVIEAAIAAGAMKGKDDGNGTATAGAPDDTGEAES